MWSLETCSKPLKTNKKLQKNNDLVVITVLTYGLTPSVRVTELLNQLVPFHYFPYFFTIDKTLVTYWMSRSYLAGVTTCLIHLVSFVYVEFISCIALNSFWPSNAIWCHTSGLTLTKIIAWCFASILNNCDCQTSNIRCTSVGNRIVDHSDAVGASPVCATSSFST